ncbi:hypothetical protein RS130_11830 [Paraglaciecola aquimarina]|uniref:Uncharacterized protein n=1 Tax=Paraglaciecola aquimarina TaxID=1235557 RepID=A0ABU3SWZ1_9ALTE|nr:hypothetical protein [Paraglaciecola aquimarina]MDU0354532.1 hypothetical protein [Paraglaciecola aquimarina]
MKNITKILSVAMSTLFLSQANAGIQVIDFDTASNGSTITNGQIVDDEYNGVAITSFINRGSIENRQVTFDTLHNSVQDNDLEFNRTDNDYNSELTRTGTDLANYNSAFSYTALEIDGHNFGPRSR